MSSRERDNRDDDEFVLGIFVAAPGGGSSDEKPTRILKIVRNGRTRSLELFLPEQNEIASLGWVPEIAYEATEAGYSLNAVIRPDLSPFLRTPVPRHHDAERGIPLRDTETSPKPVLSEPQTGLSPNAAEGRSDEVLYEVTFRNREIGVNGFILSRPNFNSENDLVFEYLFSNANRKIELAELETVIGRPLVKKLPAVVRDLGFTGDLKEMFFAGVAKTAIAFTNPVTKADFTARGLRAPQLKAR